MKHINIRGKRLLALLLAVLLLCGCTANQSKDNAASDETAAASGTSGSSVPQTPPDDFPGDMGGMFGGENNGVTTEVSAKHAELSNRDMAGTWDDASAVHITLSGASATVDGKGASFADGVLTVSAAGTYVLSGSFSGSIRVDAGKDDKVQLVLNGASVTCDNGPALWVMQADKVFVTVADGTTNALADAKTYAAQDDDGEPDACVFSKDDLTFNGAGALTVTGNYGHGIVTKDALVVYDVQLNVTAADDGLKSNDGTTVAGNAALTVTAAHDAMETSGDCILEAGTLVLNAGNDGVHGDAGVYVNGGIVDVQSSTEGLEGFVVCIADGNVTILSTDDGVNASSSGDTSEADKFSAVPGAIIAVLGGKLTVSASGDGLDSNGDLLLAGGETCISIDIHTGNSALDYNGGCELTGGTLVAAGGTDMLQSVKSDDALPVLCAAADSEQAAGTAIMLTDASGGTLLTFTPAHSWQSVILRTPDMAAGDMVTLSAGGTAVCTVTLDSAWTTYGNVAGMGGGFHGGQMPAGMEPSEGGMGGRGQRPGGKTDGAPGGQSTAPAAQEN